MSIEGVGNGRQREEGTRRGNIVGDRAYCLLFPLSSCLLFPSSPCPLVPLSPLLHSPFPFVSSSNAFLFSGGNLSIAYRRVVRGILGPCSSSNPSSRAGSGFPASRSIQPVAL